MGWVPPPLPLSKEEWLANGKRDPAFERWLNWAHPLDMIRSIFKIILGRT